MINKQNAKTKKSQEKLYTPEELDRLDDKQRLQVATALMLEEHGLATLYKGRSKPS